MPLVRFQPTRYAIDPLATGRWLDAGGYTLVAGRRWLHSLGTFSARFAELTGMSPTAYRKQAAERGGPAPIPGCFALMWRTGLPAPRSGERITS